MDFNHRLIMFTDGTLGLFYRRGTLAEGKEELKKVLMDLVGSEIKFIEEGDDLYGKIEQHRHDDPEAVHQQHKHIHFDGSRH